MNPKRKIVFVYNPTSGTISILGKRIDKMNEHELVAFRRDHVGFIYKKKDNNHYYTIEGNTGTTNQANGGEVMIRCS